jgi:hypothetical protein
MRLSSWTSPRRDRREQGRWAIGSARRQKLSHVAAQPHTCAWRPFGSAWPAEGGLCEEGGGAGSGSEGVGPAAAAMGARLRLRWRRRAAAVAWVSVDGALKRQEMDIS